jgi:hypothetical protein
VKPNYALDVANVHYAYLGKPKLADADWFVVSVDMKVGKYTLAHTSAGVGCARNVTVTTTATNGADTMGKVTVAGTDLEGAAISEEFTPVTNDVAKGALAFATITSVTGAGWSTNGGADKITVGFGDLVGLSRAVVTNIANGGVVANGIVGGAVVATPTMADDADLSGNTTDISSGTFSGSKTAFLVVVTP